MRLLVCGGRDYSDRDTLWRRLDELQPAKIIHGGASGADNLAWEYAHRNKVWWSVYPADWKRYGKRAGPMRNQEMIDHGKPDAVLAAPGGKGTADMIRRAKAAGIPVHYVYPRP